MLNNLIVLNMHDVIKARIKNKITQKKLAELSGVSLRTLVYMENGNKTSFDSIQKVRKALNLPV
jgi:transcriptional regulator with XRE-family HTH domain